MNSANENRESLRGMVGVLLALFLAIFLRDMQMGNLDWSGTTVIGGAILGISFVIAVVVRKVSRISDR
jgi:hypothetical protein